MKAALSCMLTFALAAAKASLRASTFPPLEPNHRDGASSSSRASAPLTGVVPPACQAQLNAWCNSPAIGKGCVAEEHASKCLGHGKASSTAVSCICRYPCCYPNCFPSLLP